MTKAEAFRALADKDQEIPDHLWPPMLQDGLSEWLQIFHDLSTERKVTDYAVGPIPVSLIKAEAKESGDPDLFIHCMKAMDEEYRSRANGAEQPPDEDPQQNIVLEMFRGAARK